MDALIFCTAGYVSYSMSLDLGDGNIVLAWYDFLGLIFFLIIANNFIMGRFGFYSGKRFPTFWLMIRSLFVIISLDFIALSAGVVIYRVEHFSRIFLILYFAFVFIGLLISRIIFNYCMELRARNPLNSFRILIVASTDRVAAIAGAIRSQPSFGHQIAGCLNVETDGGMGKYDLPVLGNLDDFDQVLRNSHIDEVVFALPKEHPIDLKEYLQKCETLGVAFRIVPGLYGVLGDRLRVDMIQGVPTLVTPSFDASASGLLYKRILDIVAGFAGLLVFLLMYPFVALAIKLDSKGPVLFRQLRVGKNNRLFSLYKFRTMTADAESRKAELNLQNEMSGHMFKIADDPRVTCVGRFLRKTSVDEFPQFLNVIKGEMSLVGTRPPTPEEVEKYADWHRRRISVKPGITGLWQVSGRNKINDFSEVVKLDLYYIDNWRFAYDLRILGKTIWVVLAGRGAS